MGLLTALIFWIVVGLIAGFLASVIMRGGGYGVVGDIIVGIVGSWLQRCRWKHHLEHLGCLDRCHYPDCYPSPHQWWHTPSRITGALLTRT